MNVKVKHYTNKWDEVLFAMRNGHLVSLRLWWIWRRMNWGYVYEVIFEIKELVLGLSPSAVEYFNFVQNARDTLSGLCGVNEPPSVNGCGLMNSGLENRSLLQNVGNTLQGAGAVPPPPQGYGKLHHGHGAISPTRH